MDIQKLQELVLSIELAESTILRLSVVPNEQLSDMSSVLISEIVSGAANPNAALGALIAIGMEAVERAMTAEASQ